MANINRVSWKNSALAIARWGAIVPFVARYRKEVTGALDDAQLRTLDERLSYLRELEERRVTIFSRFACMESSTPSWKQRSSLPIARGRLEDIDKFNEN